ncbi:MAG: hypothetical protein Q9227_006154 [Pyrenula ochraceoflavens]
MANPMKVSAGRTSPASMAAPEASSNHTPYFDARIFPFTEPFPVAMKSVSTQGVVQTLTPPMSSRNSTVDLTEQHISADAFENTSDRTEFNPNVHLSFRFPSKVHTMSSIGQPSDNGISETAVSEPFPLFSPEAIEKMRDEVLGNPSIFENCQFVSNIAPKGQLRGYAKDYAPFIYSAWNHPQTLEALSQVAGIDLVPAMDFEIGHVNICRPKVNGPACDESKPIVDWHTDAYPFVCVLMLSNCADMRGGETALLNHGEVMKVRGPTQGCAVILQGRYIRHKALNAFGGAERITMVTSFRPRSAHVKDDTTLWTVRPVSNLTRLYSEYSDYRLANLKERIDKKRADVDHRLYKDGGFDTAGMRAFIVEQKEFLDRMLEEIVPEDEVQMGFIPE